MTKKSETKPVALTISEPNFKQVILRLEGTAPYSQARFSEKARHQMREKMLAGSTAAKGKKREPRNFDEDYQQAMHKSKDGWVGIPASCFRNAAISACKTVGFHMTKAKLAIFVEADGYDKDGMPLVKIEGTPRPLEMPVRNATGVADIRVRPIWDTWATNVKVRFDADMFTPEDVYNLFKRVGVQVGIGEGRPDSRTSNGLGWGTFDIAVVQEGVQT